jgi:hypothetical protein
MPATHAAARFKYYELKEKPGVVDQSGDIWIKKEYCFIRTMMILENKQPFPLVDANTLLSPSSLLLVKKIAVGLTFVFNWT